MARLVWHFPILVLFFRVALWPLGGMADQGPVYLVGPLDVLDIKTIDQPDYTIEGRVDASGKIQFPGLDLVDLQGLTPDGAANKIKSLLEQKQLVKNPQVIVTVASFGHNATVLGSVGQAGVIPLDREMTLVEFLARAGGTRSDAADYLVLRHVGDPTPHRINLKRLLNGDDPTLNAVIKSGDSIYVPSAPIYYLSGSVNRPGAFPLREGMTVSQALSQGGGIAPTGSEGRIKIERRKDDGTTTKISAELTDLVQPDDIIDVPESWF